MSEQPAAVAISTGIRTGIGKNQMWAFALIGFFVLVSVATFAANELYIYLSAYLWFGFIYGMCLQGGRFCFSSAFRDLFAVGVPRMVIGIVIACVLFGITAAFVTATGMSAFHPAPWGIHSVIAGAVFGVGMVFAGGCASSSLYKTGEGNMSAALVILSISVTQAMAVALKGWTNKLVPESWHAAAVAKGLPATVNAGDGWMDQYLAGYVWNRPVATYADVIGAPNESFVGAFVGNFLLGVVVPATLLLLVVYAFWVRKGFLKKRAKQTGKPRTFSDEFAGIWSMLTASKRTSIMGVIIGITAGVHIFVMKGMQIKFGISNFGELLTKMGHAADTSIRGTVFDPGYWYITSQEGQFGAWVLDKIGWNMRDNVFFGVNNGLPDPWRNPALWMSIGIIAGAMIMSLMSKEFKFKLPKGELILWGLLGGTLMGLGSRPALGCNIGAFFIRVAGGDPSGWLYGIGMVTGAFAGVKFFNWWSERKMAAEMADF